MLSGAASISFFEEIRNPPRREQRLNAWRSSGTSLASAPPSAARRADSLTTNDRCATTVYALARLRTTRAKKNDGDAPYSVSFTATQGGDVIVQLHPHSQLERAVRHERQAHWRRPRTVHGSTVHGAPCRRAASCGAGDQEDVRWGGVITNTVQDREVHAAEAVASARPPSPS